jgi:hypothetical protein
MPCLQAVSADLTFTEPSPSLHKVLLAPCTVYFWGAATAQLAENGERFSENGERFSENGERFFPFDAPSLPSTVQSAASAAPRYVKAK